MVTVEAAVENSGFSKTDCLVYAYITDRTGKNIVQAKEQRIPLKGNGTSNVKQVMAIAGATLWSLEDLICKGLFLL